MEICKNIRFRAWHKKEKKMYEVSAIVFENKTLLVYDDKEKEPNCQRCCDWKDVIFRQSTFGYDKNGVEIFALDIVKHKNGMEYLIKAPDIDLYWYLEPCKGTTGGIITGEDMLLNESEIIGNVFNHAINK